MNEASFTMWLKDVAEETALSDGEEVEACQAFFSLGLPGNGFVIRLRDGEEFEVRVTQTVRNR